MAKFIKAYNQREDTLFEVSVKSLTKKGAKTRGTAFIMGRMPTMIFGIDSVEVLDFDERGVVKEYRVLVQVDSTDDLRRLVELGEIRQKFSDML